MTRDEIVNMIKAADAAGDEPAVRRLLAELDKQPAADAAPQQQEIGKVASALQGFGQGATFGFADEAAAGGRALLDMLQTGGDQSFGDRYRMFRDDQRGLLDAAREQNPWTTGVAEFVPGLLQGGAGLTKAAGTAATRKGLEEAGKQTLRSSLGRSAAVGAGYGGVSGVGYGEAEDLAGMGSEALGGAAMGAGLGTALPMGVAGVRRGASNLGRRLGISGQGVEDAAQEAARREVLKLMKRDKISMEDANRILAEQNLATLADLSPSLRAGAVNVAKTPGEGGQQIRDYAQKRAEGAYGRIIPKLRAQLVDADSTSSNIMVPDNYARAEREVMDRARQIAKDEGLWENAYPSGYQPPRTLKQFLARNAKTGKIIDKDARRADRAARDALTLRMQSGEIQPNDPGLAARYAEEVLRSLKSDIKLKSNKFAPKRTTQQTKLQLDRHRRLMRDFERTMPDEWKRARQLWAHESSNQEAMDAGRKILSQDSDATRMVVEDFPSQSERDHFMIGALRAIENRMARKTETGDMLRELRSTPAGKSLMETMFGGKRGFERFMKMAREEESYLELNKKVAGGSDTFTNFAQGQDIGGAYGTLAGIMMGTNLGIPGLPLLARFAGRKGAEVLERSDVLKRNQMAKMLLSRNPEQLTERMVRPAMPLPGATMGLGLAGATQAGGLLE